MKGIAGAVPFLFVMSSPMATLPFLVVGVRAKLTNHLNWLGAFLICIFIPRVVN
jgi:hypothetical protein